MENKVVVNDWTSVSEVELIYKTKCKTTDRPVIKKSRDIADLMRTKWNENTIELREEFKVLLLNRANKVLGIYPLSTGGTTGTVADPRLIFAAALKANAIMIALCHNHPSGNLTPSEADKQMTNKLAEAAKLFDMRVLDHIILSPESYFSFSDEGLL